LGRLLQSRRVVRYDKERGGLVGRARLEALKARALDVVTAFHAEKPLEPGMGREELRTKVTDDVKLLHVLVEALIADQALILDRDLVRLPTHDPKRSSAAIGLQPLAER